MRNDSNKKRDFKYCTKKISNKTNAGNGLLKTQLLQHYGRTATQPMYQVKDIKM